MKEGFVLLFDNTTVEGMLAMLTLYSDHSLTIMHIT